MITNEQVIAAIASFYKSSMRKALEAHEQSKWVDVKERLPEDGTTVVVVDVNYAAKEPYVEYGTSFFSNGDFECEYFCHVTHWQPLPKFKE